MGHALYRYVGCCAPPPTGRRLCLLPYAGLYPECLPYLRSTVYACEYMIVQSPRMRRILGPAATRDAPRAAPPPAAWPARARTPTVVRTRGPARAPVRPRSVRGPGLSGPVKIVRTKQHRSTMNPRHLYTVFTQHSIQASKDRTASQLPSDHNRDAVTLDKQTSATHSTDANRHISTSTNSDLRL